MPSAVLVQGYSTASPSTTAFPGQHWGMLVVLVLASPILSCTKLHALESRAVTSPPPHPGSLNALLPVLPGDRSLTSTDGAIALSPEEVSAAIETAPVEELRADQTTDGHPAPSPGGDRPVVPQGDASVQDEAPPSSDDRPAGLEPVSPPEPSPDTPRAADTPDPELGILRLHHPSVDEAEIGDPELGILRLWGGDPDPDGDEELGILRLRQREIEQSLEQPPAPPTVYLFAGVSYFGSSNIFLDARDPVDDQLVSGRISLGAFPALDRNTLMIVSLGGTVSLYGGESSLNYADITSRVGVRHFFLPRTYVEATWVRQELFSLNDGDRFLEDHSLRLTLARRDLITPQWSIDSFYQLRLSFADPGDRSRVTNTLGLYAGYSATPTLQLGLGYQVLLSTFTEEPRDDAYHQLLAQLSYDLSRNAQITLYGGFSFGRSSSPDIGFDSTIFGASFDLNLPLF